MKTCSFCGAPEQRSNCEYCRESNRSHEEYMASINWGYLGPKIVYVIIKTEEELYPYLNRHES